MKFESIGGVAIPKIGFGTWEIGGRSSANPAVEERSLAALHSALQLGYTHFDTAENYAAGHAEELLGSAIRDSGVERGRLFITSKIWPNHLGYDDVLRSCAGSLRRLGMEYLDLHLIHWPNQVVPLSETFRALNQLVREGRVRHIGVSNFTLRLLKQAESLAETPLFTDQVPCSLDDRSYVKNGVLAHCQRNNILLTAYSPIQSVHPRTNRVLQSIAEAHGASPYQIALTWLVAQPRVITIPMSFDPEHQAQNLAAADLELSPSEMEQLDAL